MQDNCLLEIKGLSATVGEEETQILDNIDLTVRRGEIHVIMGPNGAGKSTLGFAVMGNPAYTVSSGRIFFDGVDITDMAADKRAKQRIFLTFQNPIEIPGISMRNFLRNSIQEITGERVSFTAFNKELEAAMELIHMNPAYADRDINVGFSGGEKKKAEILQLLMLKPRLAILDETDSGLDVDAVRTVSSGIRAYMESCGGTLIIITHNAAITESLDVDQTHVLVHGRIVFTGDGDLTDEINKNGFEGYTYG